MGIETSDDAAVYQITDDVAMIQTVDFFTPVVDDPYAFGQIAAANALSDVYAMGGVPKVALNIVGFPNCLPPDILGDILRGGADKVKEAGAVLVGGHSISDDEPKYGLCVSGFVHPEKLWKNVGGRSGDVLILTKPIGTGIINTAIKSEAADEENEREAIRIMSELNKYAADVLKNYTIHACTDVTGFGLLGHLLEMTVDSDVTALLDVGNIPIAGAARAYAAQGLVPGGAYRNREYHKGQVDDTVVPDELSHILWDPQTSGGLLVCVPREEAAAVLEELRTVCPASDVAVIGRLVPRREVSIRLCTDTPVFG